MKPVFRTLDRIEDFKMIPSIEQDAWGFGDLETEPHHLMTRMRKYGGIVRGLFLADTMIGFSYALPGRWKGEYFLYSHMAAVITAFQSMGFGYLLKQDQREEALLMGYTMIRWNFDPLESLNTYFNLHRLGAVSREYERNIYGTGESGLHRGLNTDRLIAEWKLDSDRVKTAMESRVEPLILGSPPRTADWTEAKAFVEIPADIRVVKTESLEKAREWRSQTRGQLESAFKQGYIATGVGILHDRSRIFIQLNRESS
jgi:predicted GNAT superfamily acetyltransferase